MAKAFGVPLAVLTGPHSFIRNFSEHSETRVFTSPPSEANLVAARRSLDLNATSGDQWRLQLFEKVKYFRDYLKEADLFLEGRPFPVQVLRTNPGGDAVRLFHHLTGIGLRTLVITGHDGRLPALSFLIRRNHSWAELDRLIAGISTFFHRNNQWARSKFYL